MPRARLVLSGAAAVLGASLAAAAPAWAAMPTQVDRLCRLAEDGCAVTAGGWLREGITTSVSVRGTVGARVQVVIYRAVVTGGRLTGLEPISRGGDVIVGDRGATTTSVVLPATAREPSVGWALVSVAGVTVANLPESVGEFVPFGARTPTVLGDGFALRKPVGPTLELRVVGAIPGTRFAVDLQDVQGVWREVTSGVAVAADDPSQVFTVPYTLPPGLAPQPVNARLRNVSDTGVVDTWQVLPAYTGDVEAPDAPFSPPEVGSALRIGTPGRTESPDNAIRAVAAGIAVGCLGAVTVLTPRAAARRRLRLDGWQRGDAQPGGSGAGGAGTGDSGPGQAGRGDADLVEAGHDDG